MAPYEFIKTMTVNQRVAGSSPAAGANKALKFSVFLCFIYTYYIHFPMINIIWDIPAITSTG